MESSRPGSRFGRLSSNMFFTRNTAKPKRVRHIEGLNGTWVCNVNDLPSGETPRHVERSLPPMRLRDADRWQQELASLAAASGLGLEREDPTSMQRPSPSPLPQRYSSRTGRFNEGTPKSRGRTSSRLGTPQSDTLFNMPENERELWMLQVLCQLLGTSNFEDVQSWLTSASPSEKEQARAMIHTALRGFEESERTPQKFLKGGPLNRSSLQSIKEEDSIDSSVRAPFQSETTYSQSYGNFNTPVQPSPAENTKHQRVDSLRVNEDSVDDDDNVKSRQIRELKSKLSRQEEESKRQLNELQAKQVRLENALKLLVQQSAAREKSHLPTVNRKAPSENARFRGKQQERNASNERGFKSTTALWRPDTSVTHLF